MIIEIKFKFVPQWDIVKNPTPMAKVPFFGGGGQCSTHYGCSKHVKTYNGS